MLKYTMVFLLLFLLSLMSLLAGEAKASPYCEIIPYTELKDFTDEELSDRYCVVASKSYNITDIFLTKMKTTMQSKIVLYRQMSYFLGVCYAEQRKVKRVTTRKKVKLTESCDLETFMEGV